MPDILSSINSISVEFASTVGKEVKQTMIDGLKHCIKGDVADGHTLNKIYISSANDSHTSPSRHCVGKAVDISRINGTKISVGYTPNSDVKAIVDAIQDTFESYGQCRENFGPNLKNKLGNAWSVTGHSDHIHLSVN